jgi:hypothetical protein
MPTIRPPASIARFPILSHNADTMEADTDFNGQLNGALDVRQAHYDRELMPDLKTSFKKFHSAYLGLYQLLLNKGLIRPDPYRLEKKISEIELPQSGPFIETEKVEEMSIRLSDYDIQLEFLNSYYQFSTDFLNLNRLKTLAALIKYIRWEELLPTTNSMTTRVMAEFVHNIKSSTDSLSINLITDATEQLKKTSKIILSNLKKINIYHRERYKLEVRQKVLSSLDLKAGSSHSNDDVLQKVKRKFPTAMEGSPFYRELVAEIIAESFGPEGEGLRKKLLDSLKVQAAVSVKKNKPPSYMAILFDALRALATASRFLEEAIKKFKFNSVLLESRKKGFFEKLKRWLYLMSNKKEMPLIYQIEYFDVVTSSSKMDALDFHSFLENMQKMNRIFIGITSRMGSIYKKLEDASDDQIYQFLNKYIGGLQSTHKKMEALDTYFKTEVPREKVKGIKIELSSIKNSIIKANQKKHEYVAKKEEHEQFKKLGIDPDA